MAEEKDLNKLAKELMPLILELFEKYNSSWTTEKYTKAIKNGINMGHNGLYICYSFDCVMQKLLSEYQIKLSDIVLKRDQEALDIIDISQKIIEKLNYDLYQNNKKKLFENLKEFFNLIEYNSNKINDVLEYGEEQFDVIQSYFNILNTMEFHQMAKGKDGSNNPPIITDHIDVFSDVFTAVEAFKKFPLESNIIAICGIKDDTENCDKLFFEHEFGYYCYLIKKGENIWIFSDIKRKEYDYMQTWINTSQFTNRRDLYKDDLMPYIELGDFQYVWKITDLAGNEYNINTDKYYITRKDRDWSLFFLRELEPKALLLQFFMLHFMKHRFFNEKVEPMKLSYTTPQLNLLNNNKLIGTKYLPVAYDDNIEIKHIEIKELFDKIPFLDDIDLTDDLIKVFWDLRTKMLMPKEIIKECIDEIYEEKYSLLVFRDLNHNFKLISSNDEILDDEFQYVTGREWEYSNRYGFNKEKYLKEKPIFVTNKYFGTDDDYYNYIKYIINENAKVKFCNKIRQKWYDKIEPVISNFINSLLDEKYKDEFIYKTMLDALTNKENCRLSDYFEYNPYANNIWIYDKSLKEQDFLCGCVLNGSKSISYKMFVHLNSLDDIKKYFTLNNEDEIPFYIKYKNFSFNNRCDINRMYPSMKKSIIKIFENNPVYYISKRGLNNFKKKYHINCEGINK